MKNLESNVYQIFKKIRGENAMDGNTVWYKEYSLTRKLNFRQVDFKHDSALLTRMLNMKGNLVQSIWGVTGRGYYQTNWIVFIKLRNQISNDLFSVKMIDRIDYFGWHPQWIRIFQKTINKRHFKTFRFLSKSKISREYAKSLMEEQFPPVILNQDINSTNKQKSFKWFYRLFKYASLQGLL